MQKSVPSMFALGQNQRFCSAITASALLRKRTLRYTTAFRVGDCTMPRQEILDQIEKYVRPFRITKGKDFRLKDFDPGDTRGLKMEKEEAAKLLQRGTVWLAEEQEMLYAQDRWSLLLIFQAM